MGWKLLLLCVVFTLCGNAYAQNIIYVDDDAAGDGSSWVEAFTHLQDALAAAAHGDVIRVAAGIYYTDQGIEVTSGDRNSAFSLITGVTIQGGYAGNGNEDPDERAPAVYETVLSGDIGFKGFPGDNSYHVVVGSGVDTEAVVEGVTISGATGSNGGGVYISSGSPTFTDVVIRDNAVTSNGGGMYSYAGSAMLTNVTFINNSASGYGGGLYNYSGDPVLSNVTFEENVARYGGGVYNISSDLSLTDVEFVQNQATNDDNVTSWGGGFFTVSGDPVLTRVTFRSNEGEYGGGMFIDGGVPTLTDCEFTSNVASTFGGGLMVYYGGNVLLTDVIFKDNEAAWGGGIDNRSGSSVSRLTNVSFYNNHASARGGGMNANESDVLTNVIFAGNTADKGGGLHVASPLQLHNTIFSGNSASYGGAIYIDGRNSSSNMDFIQGTIANNTASYDGGGIYSGGDQSIFPQVKNSILWGNTAGGNGNQFYEAGNGTTLFVSSLIEGGVPESGAFDGGANLDVDPYFADADGDDGVFGTADDNLQLLSDSPAIDAGDNSLLPLDVNDLDVDTDTGELLPWDFNGEPRRVDEPDVADLGSGTAPLVDMGAFEYQDDALPVELEAFEVILEGESAVLAWSTLSETNNAGFEVQHKQLGSFKTIALIEGHGTSLQRALYNYRVQQLSAGRHVFRLKQVDFDGAFEYSPEVEVVVTLARSHTLSQAYPNPFNSQTQIELSIAREQSIDVEVYDALGRRVTLLYSGDLQANLLRKFAFRAEMLPNGMYWIHVKGEHFSEVRSVLLLK